MTGKRNTQRSELAQTLFLFLYPLPISKWSWLFSQVSFLGQQHKQQQLPSRTCYEFRNYIKLSALYTWFPFILTKALWSRSIIFFLYFELLAASKKPHNSNWQCNNQSLEIKQASGLSGLRASSRNFQSLHPQHVGFVLRLITSWSWDTCHQQQSIIPSPHSTEPAALLYLIDPK